MTRLNLSAAAAALLLLPVAACGNGKSTDAAPASRSADASDASDPAGATTSPSTTTDETTYDATAGADADMDAATGATTVTGVTTAGTTYLGANDISGKDFIGEPIYNDAGDEVGTVDDVLIGMNGRADRLVFTSEGEFFGLGDRKGTVPFSSVTLGFTEPQEPIVRVSITEQQAATATEFKQEGLNDYRLVSEIIGAEVDIAGSDDDEARIEDVIMSKDGMAKTVVVQRSAVGVAAGDMYAFDYSALSVEEGDGGLTLNVSESQLNDANKFNRTRSQSNGGMTDRN